MRFGCMRTSLCQCPDKAPASRPLHILGYPGTVSQCKVAMPSNIHIILHETHMGWRLRRRGCSGRRPRS